ncbi:MAG: hypothetical protein KF760_08185 [Candidatus Eremiobacteraeota bacterium]|nr:hypothetical protein [Candidatus Eremiobacteraeota bacterium]MCW5867953.1 hypothetical protein [Candidatus Eremiobacteraeota bacterium]
MQIRPKPILREKEAKKLKDDVVEPLKKTIEVAGVTVVRPEAWRGAVGSIKAVDQVASHHLTTGLRNVTAGLGAAGGALGGVVGVAQIVEGARQGKPKLMLSGATEVTLATATFAAMGLVSGGAALAPVGAGLLGLRGVQQVHSSTGAARLEGWRDLITSASVSAALLHAPTAVVASLGVTALGFNAIRGLSRIKQGQDEQDPFRAAKGHGALLSAAGVGLITTGLGVAPGVGLLVAGAALPLLQRWKRTQSAVDKFTAWASPKLYPMAARAEKAEEAVQKRVKPLIEPALQFSSRVWKSKPMQPVRLASRWTGRRMTHLSNTLGGWLNQAKETIKH